MGLNRVGERLEEAFGHYLVMAIPRVCRAVRVGEDGGDPTSVYCATARERTSSILSSAWTMFSRELA
jgi:hypothetical protein